MADAEPIELEPSTGATIRPDLRRPIFEPPPVRLVAVNDIHLPAANGREKELQSFYVELLKFMPTRRDDGAFAFAAENVDLVFDLAEPPIDRENLAPTMLEVPSLRDLRDALLGREIAYEKMQGLMPGTEYLLVRDPAGNLLGVGGWRLFS